ncbi:hypothetical protein ABH926_004339 [Catenulispora sp. GP43]|uniref:Ig domain-containing protein n=1 Tax=Catenulispora sp. GP43 TaxID=3156263 RepID=UPI0035110B65
MSSRRIGSRSRLAAALLAMAVAALGAGTARAASGPSSPAPDPHPAALGWTDVNGKWVQINAVHPHSMPDAQHAPVRTATGGPTPKPGAVEPNNYNFQEYYHGGQDSVGVTTGPPRVYLVYWGSQWGSPAAGANGDVTLPGDPVSAAPYQQDFFKGLGTDGDGWSAVLTQYCEGIAANATSCPAGASHVAYPQPGQTLAGVWVDNAAPSPHAANEPQIATEVAAAAQHFGNTTPESNRNVQYVINTPEGTDPDSWQELGYCAWHTYERSTYGTIAYTLMPYLVDNKYCGTNWINPGPRGILDGYGIIGGHEYAETLTDTNAIGGWTDPTGQEDADKCAWIPEGTNGGLFNLQLATGSFPVQTTWSNNDHLCMGSDPVYTNKPLLLSTPCDQTARPGSPVLLPVIATDTASSPITYRASGLPAGLSQDPATGVITGSTQATGYQHVTLTAADVAGNSDSVSFWWGFYGYGQTGCIGIEQLLDGGFENGSATVDGTAMTANWNPSAYNIITPSTLHQAHSGSWYAWLGQDTAADDSIVQWVETTPGTTGATFSFWLNVDSANPAATGQDTLELQLWDQFSRKEIGVVKTWTNLDRTNGYQQQVVDLTPWVNEGLGFGSTVGVKLVSHEAGSVAQTAFLVDDASFKLN